MIQTRRPELLCPAGDLTRLRAAVDFGADAVYLAGESFGMRAAAANFSPDALREGVAYAHARGVAVHVTCNILPHEGEMADFPAFVRMVAAAGADAVIVADLGCMEIVRREAPGLSIHVSVQAGVVNSATARAFYDLGASRVVLARELSLEEIAAIRANTPSELELEAFVHGAMCVSVSGRCLLSSYMTGRDANRGDCAQPCRWSYALMEEKRPGQYFEIGEGERGSYILNANDLCMAAHSDRLAAAGVDSFKLEGRAKSHYYTAVVTAAYRGAVDAYLADPAHYTLPDWVAEELEKISHRPYSTGFYFGRPAQGQTYPDAGYIRAYTVAGIAEGCRDGLLCFRVKNKFYKGQVFDCLQPGERPFLLSCEALYNAEGEPIESAPHPEMPVYIPCDRPVRPGALLRMKCE